MIGIIDVTQVGLIILGGLIALIIQSTPRLKRFAPNSILAFIEGIIIAYILDDFLPVSNLTYGDVIATITFIVFLIIQLVPMLRDWLKSRDEKFKRIEEHLHQNDIKLANIEGKIDALLHKPQTSNLHKEENKT